MNLSAGLDKLEESEIIENLEEMDQDFSEYEKKNRISPTVQNCISKLLESFWILREIDEKLFYQIVEHESELKRYFRETFRYRLVLTHDLAKLEKIPVVARKWMGEKVNNGTPVFKTPRDYQFFFLILAFLEGRKDDQQFSLKNICEYLELLSEEPLTWKDGGGYQNRLSLVRVMKYAVKMNLIQIVDEDLEAFSSDHAHDVLMQRTSYMTYFARIFQENVSEWQSLDDFLAYLEFENGEDNIERKHRFYRRLILEPVVYHDEITAEENEYVKNYYQYIENHLYNYYEYSYERYQKTSMLMKTERSVGEQLYPSDNMVTKIIMLFAAYLFDRRMTYPLNVNAQIELSDVDFKQILSELKDNYKQFWTKKMKQAAPTEIQSELVEEMKKWNFIEESENGEWFVKEGIFRFLGDYRNAREE